MKYKEAIHNMIEEVNPKYLKRIYYVVYTFWREN